MLLEKVNNITEWINEIEPGEVKSAYLQCARLQSLNCLASRFNQSRGKERDKPQLVPKKEERIRNNRALVREEVNPFM